MQNGAQHDAPAEIPGGDCFAVCGPKGDTIYADKARFQKIMKVVVTKIFPETPERRLSLTVSEQ